MWCCCLCLRAGSEGPARYPGRAGERAVHGHPAQTSFLRGHTRGMCVRPGQARAGFSCCMPALSARVFRTDLTQTALGFCFVMASSWLWQCAGHLTEGQGCVLLLSLSLSRAHLLGCQGRPVVRTSPRYLVRSTDEPS